MSTPFVTGILGLLRSINPLLTKDAIRTILVENSSQAGAHTNELGFGIPDVAADALMEEPGLRTRRGVLLVPETAGAFALPGLDRIRAHG